MTIRTAGPGGRLPRLLLLVAAALAPLWVWAPQAGHAQDQLERQYMEGCQAAGARNAPLAAPDYVRDICTCRYRSLRQRLTGPQIEALAQAYKTPTEWGTVEQGVMDVDVETARTCIRRVQGGP